MTPMDADMLTAYELVLLQFSPDATSEELLNVGVLAFCAESRQLHYKVTDRVARLRAVYPELDGMAYRRLARGISARCGRIARELATDQLRLFASDDIQALTQRIILGDSPNFSWSSVRYGASENVKDRVEEVFHEYVGRMEERPHRDRVDDDRLWKSFTDHPKVKRVIEVIDRPYHMETPLYSHTFRGSWRSGPLQLVEPISLDYANPSEMREQMVKWHGIVDVLSEQHEFRLVALVTDRPTGSPGETYDGAIQILHRHPLVRDIIRQRDAGHLADIVLEDLDAAD